MLVLKLTVTIVDICYNWTVLIWLGIEYYSRNYYDHVICVTFIKLKKLQFEPFQKALTLYPLPNKIIIFLYFRLNSSERIANLQYYTICNNK